MAFLLVPAGAAGLTFAIEVASYAAGMFAWWWHSSSSPAHAPGATEADHRREEFARAEVGHAEHALNNSIPGNQATHDDATIASQLKNLEKAKQHLQEIQDEILKKEEDKKSYPVPDFLKKAVKSGKINLAVSGNSGVGKSTFINFIRDIKKKDPLWAKTGTTECTMKPECYTAKSGDHLWDLPGAGTPMFPAETYVKTMGIRYFDAVFIITAERFTEAELELKNELDNFKVPYFCVRSKADLIVEDAVRNFKDDEDKDQEQELTGETMQELKDKACKEVRDHFKKVYGIDVYFLSNLPKYRDAYDLEKLKEVLEIQVSNARLSHECPVCFETYTQYGGLPEHKLHMASCRHGYCECCRSKLDCCPICRDIGNQYSPAH